VTETDTDGTGTGPAAGAGATDALAAGDATSFTVDAAPSVTPAAAETTFGAAAAVETTSLAASTVVDAASRVALAAVEATVLDAFVAVDATDGGVRPTSVPSVAGRATGARPTAGPGVDAGAEPEEECATALDGECAAALGRAAAGDRLVLALRAPAPVSVHSAGRTNAAGSASGAWASTVARVNGGVNCAPITPSAPRTPCPPSVLGSIGEEIRATPHNAAADAARSVAALGPTAVSPPAWRPAALPKPDPSDRCLAPAPEPDERRLRMADPFISTPVSPPRRSPPTVGTVSPGDRRNL
jgi:nicotinate-nucleotide--dimethylbenzimidazole phosphoribosyltransferase